MQGEEQTHLPVFLNDTVVVPSRASVSSTSSVFLVRLTYWLLLAGAENKWCSVFWGTGTLLGNSLLLGPERTPQNCKLLFAGWMKSNEHCSPR